MEDAKMMQMLGRINDAMQKMYSRLDNIDVRLDGMDARLDRMEERLDTLERGQTSIRRDIARVDRKVENLSLDLSYVLPNITDNASMKAAK